MARGIVLNIGTHPITLHPDGRTVGTREWAEDVDLDDPVNSQAVTDGHLTVLTQVPVNSPRTESGEPIQPPTPSGPSRSEV
jgi:hypothetical protein